MNEIFGKRFKQLRVDTKLKQQDFVETFNKKYNFNFTRQAISLYENGKRIPEIDALTSFADYFGVTVDYLLGRTDQRNLHMEKPTLDEGITTIAAHKINVNEELPDDAIEKINEYIRLVELDYKNNNK
ncbi:MAG: helix-turn-helix transcriptional regulator [Bacilli bacterium]